MTEHEREKSLKAQKKADLNFRPLLFCALGLMFGISLYGKIAFGGVKPSDFLLLGLIFLLVLRPFSFKRFAAVALSLTLFTGVGALSVFFYHRDFSAAEAREGALTGTVQSVSRKGGFSLAVLTDLSADGEELSGKCYLYLSGENVLPADVISVTAKLAPAVQTLDGDGEYFFSQNIRYRARAESFTKIGESKNVFLRLNRALWRALEENMDADDSGVAYALLTGDTGSMDSSFQENVNRGGLAHIFAVSGMHIGVLFSAICLLLRPIGKYRYLPAAAVAFCYSAFCGFTASSVRAFLMCSCFGATKFFGEKHDYVNSVSLAALLILLFSPRQWFSWGFRLTFGACAGLGLFAGSFSRLFSKLNLRPRSLFSYLSGFFGVQLFIFPLQIELAGYFPVWGIVFNLLFVPVLPVLFLGLLICSALGVLIPPAAPFFFALPSGMLSVFSFCFAAVDSSFVLKGFSLGAGAIVWLMGCLLLSERVRGALRGKAIAAACLVCLFSAAMVMENAVFSGCKIEVRGDGDGSAVLISTKDARVLLLGEDMSLKACNDFLSRTYAGELDGVVILSENSLSAINQAAFLPAKRIYAAREVETGLLHTAFSFGESFSLGGMNFRFFGADRLVFSAEGVAVEVDFGGETPMGLDLFLTKAQAGLKFFLKSGKIYS